MNAQPPSGHLKFHGTAVRQCEAHLKARASKRARALLQGFGKDEHGNRTGFNTMVYSEPEVGGAQSDLNGLYDVMYHVHKRTLRCAYMFGPRCT